MVSSDKAISESKIPFPYYLLFRKQTHFLRYRLTNIGMLRDHTAVKHGLVIKAQRSELLQN